MAFDYLMRIISVLNQPLKTAMKNKETKGWKLRDSRRISCGVEYALRVPFGSSYEQAEKCLGGLVATCGKPVELEDWDGSIVVRVIEKPMPTMIKFHPKMLEELKPGEILIGYTITGEKITFNWEMPHGIAAGETGMGKTDWIRLFAYCLLRDPEGIDIRIIDLKLLSFLPFKGVKNITLGTGIKDAHDMLKSAAEEVVRRNRYVEQAGSRKAIKGLQKVVIIIDEAADIAPSAFGHDAKMKNVAIACENFISTITRMGREVRVHLLYCTQYPTNKLLSNQIKINCGMRMCFWLPTPKSSEVVLDKTGAEALNGIEGRAIFKNKQYVTIQVPFVGNDDVWEKKLQPFKQEVIYGGASSRTDKERVHTEGTFRYADRDNQPTSNVVQLQLPAIQESKPTSSGNIERKTGGMGLAQEAEDMAPIKKRIVDDGDGTDEV